jgi:hypothetical protein
VLIVLSKQGKVYAMSSLTGRIQWMWFEARHSAEQIFVERPSSNIVGRQNLNVILVTKYNLIHLDPLTGTIVNRVKHEVDTTTHRFIMVKTESDASTLVAVPRGS